MNAPSGNMLPPNDDTDGHEAQRPSSMRSPLIVKLLLWMLPLVCIPVAVLGFLSFNTSVDTFTSLSRDNLLLQAQSAGNKVESVFNGALMDMDIISSVLNEEILYDADLPQVTAHQDIVRMLLNRFTVKSIYYCQIAIWSLDGCRLFHVFDKEAPEFIAPKERMAIIGDRDPNLTQISAIIYSSARNGFFLIISRLIYSNQGIPIGYLVIDFDYQRLIDELISQITPPRGYAFMVNKSGQILFHPEYAPYAYNLLNQQEPTIRKFIVEMLVGQRGWAIYKQDEVRHAAAYAPINTPGWSIAISIPLDEFKKDAMVLRTKIFALVFLTIGVCATILYFISLHILKPVKGLVGATRSIADGHFDLELKVTSNDEVGLLTAAFNNMTKKLKITQTKLIEAEKMASLGRFSAGIAHEVRNPLSAMKGAATYIKRRRSDDALVMEYIDLICNGIERLDTFIKDFRYFSKQNTPRLRVVNIRSLLHTVVTLFNEAAAQQKVQIIEQVDQAPLLIQIDERQMEQVFMNIIVNALQAMPDGGQLTITTQVHTDTIVILFRDTGCGVRAEDMKNIFDPFFSTKDHGTGLGLPICHGIVHAHGGQLSLQSELGHGSTAIVVLPLT